MGWSSKSGRARTSVTSPQAFAVCDRCGIWYNHVDLSWQFDWRGAALQNIRMLVCKRCLDVPQQQQRSIVLPADPVPIENARIEYFQCAETDFFTISGQDTTDPKTGIPVPGTTTLITQANKQLVKQQTGEPPGGLNTTPGIDPNAPGSDDPGLPYGNDEVPKTGPLT